jgi:hypothetical protein
MRVHDHAFMQMGRGFCWITASRVSRLRTPSDGSLSAMSAPILAGVAGSVRVNDRPSVCSLCGRGAVRPEMVATQRPEARRVHTGHLVSVALPPRRGETKSRPMTCATSFGDTGSDRPVTQRTQQRGDYGNGGSPSSFRNALCLSVATRISPSSSTNLRCVSARSTSGSSCAVLT